MINLSKLTSDEVYMAMAVSPEALLHVLERLPVVKEVSLQIAENGRQVDEKELRSFIDSVLKNFQKGFHCSGDYPLAALAVAMRQAEGNHVDKFYNDLSQLHIQEMIMSPRIARLVLKKR